LLNSCRRATGPGRSADHVAFARSRRRAVIEQALASIDTDSFNAPPARRSFLLMRRPGNSVAGNASRKFGFCLLPRVKPVVSRHSPTGGRRWWIRLMGMTTETPLCRSLIVRWQRSTLDDALGFRPIGRRKTIHGFSFARCEISACFLRYARDGLRPASLR